MRSLFAAAATLAALAFSAPAAAESRVASVSGDIPAARRADYRAALGQVRARAARSRDRFHVVVEAPFIVIGDDSAPAVKRRAERTVRSTVRLLKKAYFERDPTDIIEVWLFRNNASYRRNARAIFGDDPDTPYGYFSPTHGALVMNIATGGGTLVHEIVHPYVDANVPDAPAWFNEGLGSLYEGSAHRGGHIVGVLNWRLPGLQEALRDGAVPKFRKLMAMSDNQFYGRGSGVHYAQARYLLYYLQERGELHGYYRRWMAARRTDPTGFKTLADVLGERDMAAFQRRWSAWALGLRYRR